MFEFYSVESITLQFIPYNCVGVGYNKPSYSVIDTEANAPENISAQMSYGNCQMAGPNKTNTRVINNIQHISSLKQAKTILKTNGSYSSAEKWEDPINISMYTQSPVGTVAVVYGQAVYTIRYVFSGQRAPNVSQLDPSVGVAAILADTAQVIKAVCGLDENEGDIYNDLGPNPKPVQGKELYPDTDQSEGPWAPQENPNLAARSRASTSTSNPRNGVNGMISLDDLITRLNKKD